MALPIVIADLPAQNNSIDADSATTDQLRNLLSDRSQLPPEIRSWVRYLDIPFADIVDGELDSFRTFFLFVDILLDIDKKALNDLAPYLFTALFANDYTPLPNRSDEELLGLARSGEDLAGILLKCRRSRKPGYSTGNYPF
jgi:hypothetical protein